MVEVTAVILEAAVATDVAVGEDDDDVDVASLLEVDEPSVAVGTASVLDDIELVSNDNPVVLRMVDDPWFNPPQVCTASLVVPTGNVTMPANPVVRLTEDEEEMVLVSVLVLACVLVLVGVLVLEVVVVLAVVVRPNQPRVDLRSGVGVVPSVDVVVVVLALVGSAVVVDVVRPNQP